MRVQVIFLGPAQDLAGCERAALDIAEPATVSDMVAMLKAQYPKLKHGVASMRVAVNQEFARPERVLSEGDEVALIPPVSGGADDGAVWVELVDGPIPAGRVRAFVSGHRELGGIVSFEGVTRAEIDPQHGALRHLHYEAYDSMATEQLRRLALEAREQRSAGRVAILHRLGVVPVGQVSVMIAVASGHRGESFDTCRWLIDRLKQDVPIWKKDVYEDGHEHWVQPP
jgi:molybdopterin synthase catalytic subunit